MWIWLCGCSFTSVADLIKVHFSINLNLMFGATKGPNSSQYDFTGTSVNHSLFSLNHHHLPTSPLPPELEVPVVEEHLEDHNPTREEVSATSLQTKPMNWKVPSTVMLWLPRTATIQRRTSRSWKKKSMFCLRNASNLRDKVVFWLLSTISWCFGKGQRGYQQRKKSEETKRKFQYCRPHQCGAFLRSCSQSCSLSWSRRHVPRSSHQI